MNDKLLDYRFYRPDMLHPTDQTVDYIRERFDETFFSDETRRFQRMAAHSSLKSPSFNPESEEHKAFMRQTQEKLQALARKWEGMEI